MLLLSACSLWQESKPLSRAQLARQEAIDNPASSVTINAVTSSAQKPKFIPQQETETEYWAELTWDVPEEPVEGFIIYSGNTPDNLSTETRLDLSDLRMIEGKKFRYLIRAVDDSANLYVSIAATNKGVVSERTAPQKIVSEQLRSEPPTEFNSE